MFLLSSVDSTIEVKLLFDSYDLTPTTGVGAPTDKAGVVEFIRQQGHIICFTIV